MPRNLDEIEEQLSTAMEEGVVSWTATATAVVDLIQAVRHELNNQQQQLNHLFELIKAMKK
jgi:hypothetical protein